MFATSGVAVADVFVAQAVYSAAIASAGDADLRTTTV